MGLQVASILTGAVNTGYMRFIDPNLQLSKTKEITLSKMAQMLGWDCLHYDTYPMQSSNKDFNIWHFPQANRGRPNTRDVVLGNTITEIPAGDL